MNDLCASILPHRTAVSPLVLSDRLICLAQDAERAGFTGMAERLVTLACDVLDEPAALKRGQHRRRAPRHASAAPPTAH